MTQTDADEIIARAREAQAVWSGQTVSQRCEVLGRLRRAIALRCEAIAELIADEVGKPVLDALSGDVMVTLEMLRYYEFHSAGILRSRRLGKPAFFFRGARFESHFEPHGVALIFGPSNYPFQLSMVPLATALTAGNAVVLKCSEKTPETAACIAQLCVEAGLPAGLVQVLHTKPRESAELIDAGTDIVFFTGSSRHGHLVAERAARHLIPTILELGGKDASLVFADCNVARAVEGTVYGAFSNSGRVCVSIKRVYVEQSLYATFLERLKLRAAELKVSMGPTADLCPISDDQRSELRASIEDALERGATLEYPGTIAEVGDKPVILSGVSAEARLLEEESFGPVLCVASFTDESHALALANASAFALSGSVWTRDKARARRIAAGFSSGSCAVNDVVRVIANPYAAFGGNRLSGYGRYHGPEGLRSFSRIKTIMIAANRREREIHWFPFTSSTQTKLAKLLRFRHGRKSLTAWLRGALTLILLAGMLATQAHPQSIAQAHLAIRVQLTPQAHGELAYLVFNSAAGFPGDSVKAVRHGFVPIPPGAGQLVIETELPPGLYAVSIYEDRNSNHKLDHNILGIPREPVGASDNPRPRMGPPRFSDSSFRLEGARQTIDITMVKGL